MSRMTLQQMRDGVRRALGVDEDDEGFDDSGVDMYLNRSWWEISAMFKFKERESSTNFNTVDGTAAIDLDTTSVEAVQGVSIKDINSLQYSPLEEMTLRDYDTNFVDRTEAKGKPTHFIRRDDDIILWPTPNDEYVVRVWHLAILADIISSGVTIPHEWDEVIMLGGAWRGAVDLGDSTKKRLLKETQMELLGTKETVDVKEKVNRAFSGVQVYRPQYR